MTYSSEITCLGLFPIICSPHLISHSLFSCYSLPLSSYWTSFSNVHLLSSAWGVMHVRTPVLNCFTVSAVWELYIFSFGKLHSFLVLELHCLILIYFSKKYCCFSFYFQAYFLAFPFFLQSYSSYVPYVLSFIWQLAIQSFPAMTSYRLWFMSLSSLLLM